jgi:hypothetical protein
VLDEAAERLAEILVSQWEHERSANDEPPRRATDFLGGTADASGLARH